MRLFPRENYLKKIRGFYHDDGMVKVITGVSSLASAAAANLFHARTFPTKERNSCCS